MWSIKIAWFSFWGALNEIKRETGLQPMHYRARIYFGRRLHLIDVIRDVCNIVSRPFAIYVNTLVEFIEHFSNFLNVA